MLHVRQKIFRKLAFMTENQRVIVGSLGELVESHFITKKGKKSLLREKNTFCKIRKHSTHRSRMSLQPFFAVVVDFFFPDRHYLLEGIN